jgi:tetratricopeptide (TPR) repeat protein
MLERSILTAEAANEQAAQAYAHMISCLYYVGVGDWTSAERSAERCQELCEPMDDRVNWTNAQAVRFWMSYYREHDASAFDAAWRLRDRASETGNRQHRAWAYRFLALCALRRGDYREAASQLQEGLDCLGETAAVNERVPTLGILALAQLRAGDVWPARATAATGLSHALRVRRPIGHSTLEGYSSLLTVALNAWDERAPGDWKTAIHTCLRILERYRRGFPVGEPRYQQHRGEYLRRRGRTRAARRSYRRGEAAATRIGMPWEAKRCLEALAQSDRP